MAEEAVSRTPWRIPGGSAGASPSQRLSHCPGKRAAAVAHRALADAEQGRPAADHAAGRLVATRPLAVWGQLIL